MNRIKNLFSALTRFERILYAVSVTLVLIGGLASGMEDLLSVTASLIGVTALIFVAKGYVAGQVLTVVFSLFYGIISFSRQYYGEMITYLGMSAPMAAAAAIAWMRNPFADTREVTVRALSKRNIAWLCISALLVTVPFYFILGALGNAALFVSTLSVTTSYLACALTCLRSPYYALAYASNDLVLIVLWTAAALDDLSYICMVLCFLAFLANDLYGFFCWKRMEKRQKCTQKNNKTD